MKNAAAPQSLKRAILCLRISEVLYVLIALLFAALGAVGLFGPPLNASDPAEKAMVWGFVFFLVFISLGMAVFIEIVCRHLKEGRYWAWIAALILFGIYVPSLFILLGILGLLALMKPETQAYFKK